MTTSGRHTVDAVAEADDAFSWSSYLAKFHQERPGAIEAVLARSMAGDHTPYRWLARAVSTSSRVVLDVACGSGAMSRELAAENRMVVGLDLSAAEVDLAAQRAPGPWVQADALRLPFADGSIDAVTSCLGLVVVTPMDSLLSEISRVLRPGGLLAAIAPAARPMGPADLRVLSRISGRLRAKPRFPGPVEATGFAKALQAHGLRKVEDGRQRYRFRISNRDDAELMMRAVYLPSVRWSRVESAIELLEDRAHRRGPVEVAIPMRRLVAIK